MNLNEMFRRILILTCSLILLSYADDETVSNLFKDDGSILNLEHDTFAKHIHNSERLSLVLFYLSWCGHCIDYADKYVAIADNLQDYKPHLVVSAINCAKSENSPICTDHNVTGYPTLKAVPPKSPDSVQSATKISTDHKDVVAYVESYIYTLVKGINPGGTAIRVIAGSVNKLPDDLSTPVHDSHTVYKGDLLYALRYSLAQEINLHIETSSSLPTVREYVSVLHKYFPTSDEDLKSSLSSLYAALQDIHDLKNWSAIIKAVNLIENIKGEDSFIRCRGSSPKYRGYPCTLWTLFHTLIAKASSHGESHKVLSVMRAYITNIFGCTECSENFAKMAVQIDSLDPSDDSLSVLWLWNTHNKVNNRLHGAASEDPVYLKQQFPSVDLCPMCRNARGMFDEQQVYSYLMDLYSNIKANRDDHHIYTGPTSKSESYISFMRPIGMSIFDVVLCYSFYIISIIIILLLAYVVKYRRCVKFDSMFRSISTVKSRPKSFPIY